MKKIICNPLNLEYRYQYLTSPSESPLGSYSMSREAADPTMVLYKDVYYLFASMSGGFWYSDDLYDWKFKATPELPNYDYAPDVREVGGRIIFSASKRGEACTFYECSDLLNEPFTELTSPFDFWDPDIFEDDDGRIYFYWGCTNDEPIWGIEIDAKTFLPIGERVAMFGENEHLYGWERKGENNRLGEPINEYERLVRQYVGTKPFIEGAFMNKYKGKYYLQYAAPGTESNVYADGVYVGDGPLGPFTYQAHNPFSSKPGGFITSAGHGSTFQDKEGNWWHTSTMRISKNQNFERRVGLFPCDFDEDGILYCNQNFADYPFELPLGKNTKLGETKPLMNLLSYNVKTSASSSQENFGTELAADENIRTWWAASEEDKNPWFELDLGCVQSIEAIQVNLAEHQMPDQNIPIEEQFTTLTGGRFTFWDSQITEYTLEVSVDGSSWEIVLDTHNNKTDLSHHFLVLDEVNEARYLRVSNFTIPFGGVPAISGLRVFGKGKGDAPQQVENIKFSRSEDGLNILLNWDAIKIADGYNVRYGIAPEKMYNSWQVVGKNELDLSTINKNQRYFIAIDSYNSNGVTTGEIIEVK